MFEDLKQHWPKASNPLPIVIFGAGSIVTAGMRHRMDSRASVRK